MIKVLHFIYYPLMNLLWIILGILCLLKATRSSVLLSPTQEVRRIKVIYYYLCAVILLVSLGTIITLASFCRKYDTCREYITSHTILKMLLDHFQWYIAPVYCALSIGVNRWIHRQTSATQSDSGHRAASLDKYVDRAYLAAMASVFYAFVPPILFFSLFYSGPLFFLPYVFSFLFAALVWGLYRFHHRRMLPLLRGGETALSPQSEDFRGKRNWGVFFGDIAIIGFTLLPVEFFCFFDVIALFSPHSDQFEVSALCTAASVAFVCVLFLTIGLWSGIPGKRYLTFIAVGVSVIVFDIVCLGTLRHTYPPEMRSYVINYPLFYHGITLLCTFGSLIVSGIVGFVDYRLRAGRQSNQTPPEQAPIGE